MFWKVLDETHIHSFVRSFILKKNIYEKKYLYCGAKLFISILFSVFIQAQSLV